MSEDSVPLRVHAAYVVTDGGLGQVMADDALIAALGAVLPGQVNRFAVGTMRSRREVDKRLPMRLVAGAPDPVKRAVGRAWYPRGLVHRFDCRLPPAPFEVVTVHDLAPLRFKDEGEFPRHVSSGLRRARAVVCPSMFSAQELRSEWGLTNVHVIANGLNADLQTATRLSSDDRQALGIPTRYILHVGGATDRKNLAELAAAWFALRERRPDVGLVMCGPDDVRRTRLFRQLDGVRLLGKVPTATVHNLMVSASAVVVPSVYEGYGLPAAEAIACGTPVVAARRASLPEIVDEHGILVEPDSAGLAAGMLAALVDAESNPKRTPTPGPFRSWEQAAADYVELYREVSGRQGA